MQLDDDNDEWKDSTPYQFLTIILYGIFWLWTFYLSVLLVLKRNYYPIKERSPILTIVSLFSYLIGNSRDTLILIGLELENFNIIKYGSILSSFGQFNFLIIYLIKIVRIL